VAVAAHAAAAAAAVAAAAVADELPGKTLNLYFLN
jgi:hypothetical protein